MFDPRVRLGAGVAAVLFFAQPAFAADVPVEQATRLIKNAEKNVIDARGWAIDLLDVLQQHSLPQTQENVCAAIAIIDQESGFVADPPVPGLGKLSETAIREKLAKIPLGGAVALRWLENNPTPQASFMARIRNAKSERDLDLAYRALVQHAGEIAGLEMVLRAGLLNALIEERNEIDTAGSMQVSVKFALDDAKNRRWLPMTLEDVYGVRDQLYTRQGGVYYGIKQLLAYETGYAAKIFRFADYNAGRYASRNAAFQTVIAQLAGEKLVTDGDLLRYAKDGKPLKSTTATEMALRKANLKHGLGLDNSKIRSDLLLEKQAAFITTQTYVSLRKRYRDVKKTEAAFARVPDIALNSPKLSRRFTTLRFAASVNGKYQACMKGR